MPVEVENTSPKKIIIEHVEHVEESVKIPIHSDLTVSLHHGPPGEELVDLKDSNRSRPVPCSTLTEKHYEKSVGQVPVSVKTPKSNKIIHAEIGKKYLGATSEKIRFRHTTLCVHDAVRTLCLYGYICYFLSRKRFFKCSVTTICCLNSFFLVELAGKSISCILFVNHIFVMNEDLMKSEANRLASFTSWPSSAPVHPTQLARAGFFYTGKDDEVKCFACRGRVLCWDSGDVPMDEHRKHFPSCPFVLNPETSGNIPLDAGLSSMASTISTTSAGSAPSNSTGSDAESTRTSTTNPQMTSNNNRSAAQRETHVADSALQRPPDPIYGVTESMGHLSTNPASTGISGGVFSAKQTMVSPAMMGIPFNREVLRFEQKRLDTLKLWPKRHLVDIRQIARAGMFFVGPGDKVKCVFCNGAMMNWDAGDDPAEEHFKYFGDRCPHARNEPTDNVPIDGSQVANPSTFELLNIVTDRPRHPDFAVLATRRTTFRNWPRMNTQDPDPLAEAGFFYLGTGDQVRCFFCGGGLKNWDARDEPWVEHAKWFHTCGFVRQMKGSDFVHKVKRAQALVPESTTNQGASQRKLDDGFDQRKVTAAMALPQTQVVLDMGFDREIVRQVIENRIRATGENFSNASELADTVMLQAAQRETESQNQKIPVSTRTTEPAETGTSLESAVGDTPMDEGSDAEESKEAAAGGGEPAETKSKKKKKKRKQKKKDKEGKGENEMEAESGPSVIEDTTEDPGKLLQENQELKDQKLCKICMDKDCSIVFLPCGHIVACEECAGRLKKCPICNTIIRGTVKAYFA